MCYSLLSAHELIVLRHACGENPSEQQNTHVVFLAYSP